MTEDQKPTKTEENAEAEAPIEQSGKPVKKDGAAFLIITIAVCAAVIIGTLLAVYFTQSAPASSNATEPVTTAADPVTEAETEPYPETLLGPEPVGSSLFGTLSGKSVAVIEIPSLCTELLEGGFMPRLSELAGAGAYYKNVITSAFDPDDLAFVLDTGVYAPRYGCARTVYGGASFSSLSEILKNKGYTVFTDTAADPLKAAVRSPYDSALGGLTAGTPFYAAFTDRITEYPYFSADGTLETALKTADERIGAFVAALKEKGLYENTVIVITGAGLPDADIFGGFNIKSRITAPLIITGLEPSVSDRLSSHADVMPTLLDLLGIDPENVFYSGLPLTGPERESVYVQTYLERGSLVDAETVVSADKTATPKLSKAYNVEKGTYGTAVRVKEKMAASVAFFDELERAIAYGLPEKVSRLGRRAAIKEYEMKKNETEVKRESRIEDVFPENESKDFYKNDTKLFNRAVMLSANEFDGRFDGVMFKHDGLTLLPGRTEGTFISSDVQLGEFKTLVVSWNASTSGGSVEIAVCVRRSDGTYTEPYSWGVWSAVSGVSASASSSDRDGKLDIDTLTLNKKSDAVRLIIKLKQTGGEAPILYNVTLAADVKNGKLTKTPAAKSVKLSVKKRYQMDVPEIGNRICSPTSLSMALDFYKEKGVDTKKTADGVYDNGEGIYGNWSFNVAYAGELGYNAYVDMYDMTALKWALSKSVPVICSVKIAKGQLAGSGYPDYSTDGHLLCVIGYETVDGVDWLIVNDPARKQVEVRYLVSEFEQIWRNVVYIVQKRPERFTWRIGEGTDQDLLIVADYVPEGRYNRPGGNFKVKYIVIHNTGNFSRGADALSHRNYVKADGTKTSWHYTVDDHSIYKHLPEYERAWHAGDGREGQGNTYGIGIEICVNYEHLGTTKPSEYFYRSLDNAAQLVAELMYEYKLSIKAVRQHFHFSGKNCPQVIRENDLWEPFLENIQARYEAIVAERGAK